MFSWPKAAAAALVVIIVGLIGALVLSMADGGHVKGDPRIAARQAERHRQVVAGLLAEKARQEGKLQKERAAPGSSVTEKVQAASAGENGTPGQSAAARSPAPAGLNGSFDKLESEIPGEIGIAYSVAPGAIQQLGSLEVGHAWSSFKVPIVVTLMLEQNGVLSADQTSLAASAITASDNGAAASLFSDLDSATGGGASTALEGVLSKSGRPTEVATAPPPPGAVSSWGQTEWSLAASTAFYGALSCGTYGTSERTLALADMESVIPEQHWGFGQAEFPPGSQVAFKAGWGPDGSESGPYLVRQAGVIRSPSGQLVATIAAQDSSGSFEAGVADLNRIADWVAANIPPTGSC